MKVRNFRKENAQEYSDAFRRIESLVKPAREKVQQRDRRELWWLYATRAPKVVKYLTHHRRCIAIAQLPRHLSFTFVPNGIVFANTVLLFLFDDYGAFATLQSAFHTAWVYRWSGAMGTSMRYTSTECFETFPFPPALSNLDDIGGQFHEHRKRVMLDRNEGLTKTYNRFHDPEETATDITELRRLQVEMDQAVAVAYGLQNIDLGHDFHDTKQGTRFTISETARRDVLDRLLALNHQRYSEEVAAGMHDKKAGKAKSLARRQRQQTPAPSGATPQPDLFEVLQPDLFDTAPALKES